MTVEIGHTKVEQTHMRDTTMLLMSIIVNHICLSSQGGQIIMHRVTVQITEYMLAIFTPLKKREKQPKCIL